jgi:hypothetical protein
MIEKLLNNFVRFDGLTAFGLLAVSLMLVFYAMEERAPVFVLAFSAACLLGATYGFLQGAWPFGLVEIVWSIVAFKRWRSLSRGVANNRM